MSLHQWTGGITNKVFLFSTAHNKYVVRVFGKNTDAIIDRDQEVENIQIIGFMSLYARFGNGIVVSYQNGRVVDTAMMGDWLVSEQIAILLAKMHRRTLNMEGKGATHENQIFHKTLKFIACLKPSCGTDDREDLEKKTQALSESLEKEMANVPILLCHNDLLANNILWDGETRTVSFIDYEYSGWTWPHFDIANHFFEWCGFECDMSRYPTVFQQKRFIRTYLEHLLGEVPDDIVVEDWRQKVEKLVRLSGLFWGTWALFQDQNSDVQFPYRHYGKTRLMLMEKDLPLAEDDEMRNSPLVRV
jgi:ethanolamine kinase